MLSLLSAERSHTGCALLGQFDMLFARRSALVSHLYEPDHVSFAVFVDFQTDANKVSAGRHELAVLTEAAQCRLYSPLARARSRPAIAAVCRSGQIALRAADRPLE